MSFILHFTEALLACVRTTKTRRLHVLFIDCLSRNLKGWVKRLRLLINTDPSQSNLPRFPNYTKQELTLQQQAHLVSNLTLILCREEVQVPICTEDRHKAKITQRDRQRLWRKAIDDISGGDRSSDHILVCTSICLLGVCRNKQITFILLCFLC